jgi:hypothetical protein
MVATRPQIQRPAGYVTNWRKKLVIVKRSHSACVVFQHCEAMRLRNCVCGLVKQVGAHMPDGSEMPSPPHQLQACDKRQSYHSFIPRRSISDSLIYSLALIDHSSQESQHLTRVSLSIGLTRLNNGHLQNRWPYGGISPVMSASRMHFGEKKSKRSRLWTFSWI